MTQKRTYLDHNATTPLKPAVRDLMLEILAFPGNASSVHKAGRAAKKRIEDARAAILKAVNAGPQAVLIFTASATEANNLVLKNSGAERVIVSAIEHPSVLNARTDREIIPVLPSGVIDLDALDKMLINNDRSTLISVMTVNNETGVIQPIEDVVAIAKKRGALVHTDAVQALGKIDLPKGVDYLTLSAHKIGGPQGAGCLILSNCVTVAPLLSGGNQEKNMRAGTENVAAIAGFGKAVEDVSPLPSTLRDALEKKLKAIAPDLVIYGEKEKRVSNTSMFAVPGFAAETQLIALDMADICVSNGSACSSGTVKASHVLHAMQAKDAEAALRVSFGWDSTEKDVDVFINEWEKIYNRIKSRQCPK